MLSQRLGARMHLEGNHLAVRRCPPPPHRRRRRHDLRPRVRLRRYEAMRRDRQLASLLELLISVLELGLEIAQLHPELRPDLAQLGLSRLQLGLEIEYGRGLLCFE